MDPVEYKVRHSTGQERWGRQIQNSNCKLEIGKVKTKINRV